MTEGVNLGMQYRLGLGLQDLRLNTAIYRSQAKQPKTMPTIKSRKQMSVGERQDEGALYSRYARACDGKEKAIDSWLTALGPENVERYSIKKLDHQLNRALERLQQTGHCTETTLEQFCGNLSVLAPEAYQSLGVILPKGDFLNCSQSVLDEQLAKNGREIWKHSIEITLMALEPDAICTPEKRSLFNAIEPHLPELYINFFHRLAIAGYSTLVEMDDAAKASMKEAERALKEVERKQKEQLAAEAKIQQTAAQLVDQKENERQRLERENKELTSELYELKRQNMLMQMLLESNEEEQEADTAPEFDAAAEPEDSISEQELYASIELPEDQSVVFLGGHRNFVKKVQQNHPNWRYISVADYRQAEIAKMASSKISCIIFYSKHISHPIYWMVTNQSKNVPILYLTCQNIERGEYIMRKEYAEKVLGLSAEDLRNK